MTLVPALMAILGDLLLWPGGWRGAGQKKAGDVGAGRPARTRAVWPDRVVRAIVTRRRVAAATAATFVAGLLVAASPLLSLQLGVSFVSALPRDAPVRATAAQAQAAFAEGILSPTVVLLEGDGVGEQRKALARLGRGIADVPGVAGVLGPGSQPSAAERTVLIAGNRDAARYLVVLDVDPLSADAVTAVDGLERALPGLLAGSGLVRTSFGLAGDSATASYLVHQTEDDLLRIAIAAMAANLFMLLVFLRALVASVLLLATSLLSLGATLGITTAVFAWLEPGQGLTFYVPFATAVLLLAFGSDYNIFTVGHVWEAARDRPLGRALTSALPPSIRAVSIAGFALAASFGLLAIVPLTPFRQLAFAMTLGIAVDVFLVRALLVPALLTLVGPRAAWPSSRLRDAPDERSPQALGNQET